MSASLLRQRAVLDRLTRAVAVVGFTGLVAIGALIMYDALARHFILPRVPGLGDFGEVVYAVVIISCFPAGLLHSQNVQVTILGDALGLRRWLDAFASLVTLAVFAAFAFQFLLLTLDMQTSGRVTSTVLMPVAPWWWIAAAVFVVTLPVQLWVVAARFAEAVTGADVVEERPLATTDDALEERR